MMSLIRPDAASPLTAASLTRGLSGPKMDSRVNDVAHEVVTLTGTTARGGALSARQMASMQVDAATLRRNLATLLPQQNAHLSILVAGALLSGPQGVVMPDLHAALHEVANNPAKTQALARQIESLETPKAGESGVGVALLNVLGSRTTRALVAQSVPPTAMPAGMFLAGALSRHLDTATLAG